MISEGASKRYKICFLYIPGIYRAGFCTASAVVAFVGIDHKFVVLKGNCFLSTGFFTDTTVNTGIFFPADLCSSLDAYIVFFCFEAVVLTARYAKFEFMWKFTSEISFIQFNSYIITVNISTRTDCISLTCCHCPNSRSADTRAASAFGKICCHIINII